MDQAQSLRHRMILREGRLLGAFERTPVYSLIFTKDHPANREFRAYFAKFLADESRGVLRISEQGSRGIERQGEAHWCADAEYFRESAFLDHELGEIGVKSVLIDGGYGIDEDRLAYHGGTYRTLLVMRAGESELETYAIVKSLARRAGVKKLDIAVHSVDDEREAARVFARLYEICGRFVDVEIRYLGSVQNRRETEKNTDSGFGQKFLLDFELRPALKAGFQALAKKWGLLP